LKDELTEQKTQIDEIISSYRKEKSILHDKSEQTEHQIAQLEKSINKARVNKEAIKTKLDFTKTLVEKHGGMPGGVGTILEAKESLDGIIGTIGELITVPKEYRNAIESVLGEQANYIVVDKWKNIFPAVEFIRTDKSGKVTFVALDKISKFTPKRINKPIHPDLKGICPITEKISVQKELSSMIQFLLHDVFLVENKNLTEIPIENIQSNSFKIVNKQGDINAVGFLYSQGVFSDDSLNIIGRKDRIKELEKQIGSVNQTIQDNENELKSLMEKKQELHSRISQLDDNVSASQNELESVRQKLGIDDFKIQQANNQLKRISADTEQLEIFTGDATEIDSLNYDIQVLENVRNKLQTERESFQMEEETLESERQEIDRSFSEKNSFVTRFREIVSAQGKDEKRLADQIDEYNEEVKKRKSELKDTIFQKETTKKRLKELQNALKKLFDQQKENKDSVLLMSGELNSIQEHRQNNFEKYRNFQKQAKELAEQIQDSKEHLSEIRQQLHYVDEVIHEKKIDIIDVSEEELEKSLSEYETEIKKHRQKIEDFGPVNLEALEEYDKERERLEFLQNQVNDLEEAEKTLVETITKINKTARERFVKTFDQINQNFKNIFSSFFGNSMAELKFDKTQDPLEARIEIFAQPFGKRVLSISMLSGGEKALTAIALLFAVYQVKPSPFCILDEIDAPLDDANISRFIKMLQQFSTDTQFIIVTHSKKSMEAAETLYGVTMEETGISKVVSVMLNTKEELVESSEN